PHRDWHAGRGGAVAGAAASGADRERIRPRRRVAAIPEVAEAGREVALVAQPPRHLGPRVAVAGGAQELAAARRPEPHLHALGLDARAAAARRVDRPATNDDRLAGLAAGR